MITWKLEVIVDVVLSKIFRRSTLKWFRRRFRRSEMLHQLWRQIRKARLFDLILQK